MKHPLPARPRLPLYVPVACKPALSRCRAVNVSESGIGLVATCPEEPPVREGDTIEVRFSLPSVRTPLVAEAVVQWCYPQNVPGPSPAGQNIALGLRFVRVNDRGALLSYVAAYAPQVVVAFADSREVSLAEEALGNFTELHTVGDIDALQDVLERGDVSTVVVFGSQDEALGLLDALGGATGDEVTHLPGQDFVPRVVFCARASEGRVLAAFNQGKIFRFIPPPCDRQVLRGAVTAAVNDFGLRTEQQRSALAFERALRRSQAVPLAPVPGDSAVYESDVMVQTIDTARRVAPHSVSVLLQGETGVGKEVLARLVHAASPRAEQAFFVQDCGTLTETLLESELFGHVKGAFTGATANHPGLFVLADGGTVFLDEIENTTPSLQAKLLRVLETGEIRPVGGRRTTRVDVRVIAAGNVNLRKEVDAGRLRADLYYRLSTFPILIPALRDRTADILPLARHFLALASQRLGRPLGPLTPEAESFLLGYAWPGNVRELRNIMERCAILTEPGEPIRIDAATLPTEDVAPSATGGLREQVDRFERDIIERALVEHDGVIRQAAASLDINAVTLGRKIKRYGLHGSQA